MTYNELKELRYDLKCCLTYLTRVGKAIESESCCRYRDCIISRLNKYINTVDHMEYSYLKESVLFYIDSYVRYIYGHYCEYSIDDLSKEVQLKFERKIGETNCKLKEFEKQLEELKYIKTNTFARFPHGGCEPQPIINKNGDQYYLNNCGTVLNLRPPDMFARVGVDNLTKEISGKLKKAIDKCFDKPTLDQRLKELKEKHKQIDKEHQRLVDTFKACYEVGIMLSQIWGAKTVYDLNGIIRIPKTY